MSEFLSVEELADLLRMNRATIYRLAITDKIPGFKVGRKWRFRKASIEAWIANQELSAQSDVRARGQSADVDLRCSLCERSLSGALKDASKCSADECDESICANCWTTKGRRFCQSHTVSSGDATVKKLPKESTSGLSTNAELLTRLKALEYGYIARFDTVIRENDAIKTQDGKILAMIKSWGKIHETHNELSIIKKLPTCLVDTRTLAVKYPLNTWSRYLIPLLRGQKVGDASRLAIEARVFVSHSQLLSNVASLLPVNLEDFNTIFRKIRDKSKRSEAFLIVGIFSPSGWESEVIELVAGTETKKSLKFVNGAICLIGPSMDALHWDKSDSRFEQFVRLFSADTLDEEVRAYIPIIEDKLVLSEFLSLDQLTDELDLRREVIVGACNTLARERPDLEMAKLKRVGEIIRWKK